MRQTKDQEDSTFRVCANEKYNNNAMHKKSKQTNTAVKIEKWGMKREKKNTVE